MSDASKTKEQLLDQVTRLHSRVKELEKAESERKRAEKALKIERDALQGLMDGLAATGIGVDVVSVDYKILHQNKLLIEAFGDITGRLCYESYMGLDTPCNPCPMAAAIESGNVERAEMTGSDERRYEILSAPLPSPDGVVDKAIEVVLDITERKRTEEALHESEEKLREITDNMFDLVSMADMRGKLKYVSPSHKSTLGYELEYMLGRSVFEFIHPKDIHAASETLDEGKRSLLPGKGVYRFLRADGGYCWLESVGKVLLNSEGESRGMIFSSRDITERKQTEKALLESEEKYRNLVEHSLEGIGYSAGNRIIFANRSLLDLLGYDTLDEIVAIPLMDHVAPESKDYIQERMGKIAQGESVSPTFEYTGLRKDGARWDVEISTSFVKIGKGTFTQATFRDITHRKRAEEALRESEERFHYLADAAIEAIFFSHEGYVLEVNPAAADMFRYDDPSELVGILGTDVIAPESHEIVKAHMLTNSSEPYEAVGLRKDGSKFPISIQAKSMPYKDLGEVRVASVRDISDLKEHQRRFQIIAEASADVIYEWDVSSDELLWLGDIDSELGYGQGEIPRTIEGWVGMIHPDDLAKLSDAVEHHRRSTQPIHYEYRVRHKDGNWRYWDDRGYPIVGSDNLPKKWIGACTDITDKKNMEDQLRQSQKMEAVGRLAGGVAHDFNNSLTGIIGYAQMIISDLKPGDPLRADMELIFNAGKRAADLTNQLLAFSHKQVINPKVIQPNDILDHSQKMLQRLIGEDIDFKFIPGMRLWSIKADPTQLDQIFVNLAVNARDAMPNGGKLAIETQNVTLSEQYCNSHTGMEPGDYVMLAVSDNGQGMEKEMLQNIFEPFFTTKEKGKGTGLGLSTVYGIMKQNKGLISVHSEPGTGTTFKIYFPAVKDKAKELERDKIADTSSGTETILLVEDEDMVRDLAKRVLEKQGYKVIEAPDGAKAYFAFTKHSDRIDLLLTDVIMPTMNGRVLYEKLLEIKSGLKVLFMSGYMEHTIGHHGVLDEGTHFIPKPLDLDILPRKVREVLDS